MAYDSKKSGLGTYEPEKKFEINGREVKNKAFSIGASLILLGSSLMILAGWIFYPIIAFLGLRDRFRMFRMEHERVMDLRRTRIRRR